MDPAATSDAALVEDGAAAEPELVEEPAAEEAPAAEEPAVAETLPLEVDEAAPGVGAPKVETPDGIGPTGAEAEAPTPTKLPTLCCRKLKDSNVNN